MTKKNVKKKDSAGLHKRIEELEIQLKRSLADYQNLEKRALQEKDELKKTANSRLIEKLLPALDALIITEKHTKDQGVSLSIKKFLDILESEGVKKIETQGQDFDPRLMECVQTIEVDPTTASGQEGKVMEELIPGYILGEKVLRAAQVIVGSSKLATSN